MSVGPNGPGTLFADRRQAAQEGDDGVDILLGVRAAKACHGMLGASMRPSGRLPSWIAATICASVQLPRPVTLSGVRFGP